MVALKKVGMVENFLACYHRVLAEGRICLLYCLVQTAGLDRAAMCVLFRS